MVESKLRSDTEVLAAKRGDDLQAAVDRIAALDLNDEPEPAFRLETTDSKWGAFTGTPPQIELLDDGRGARLLSPLSYTRPDGSNWPVPIGASLDGASIPRPFWPLIGGPFEGKYRNASIVHDHYCDIRSRPWRDVHRMFYEAMRCSGTGEAKAKTMYYAVYRFGPRWPDQAVPLNESPVQDVDRLAVADPGTIAADAEAIHVHHLDLDEIEALADARERHESAPRLEAVAAPDGASLDRARRLVVTGGSGDAADLEAVAVEAALLPEFVLKRFEADKVRIIACRGSVTDFETSLRGVTPRGWESTGRTWDSVPGTYFQDRKRVVIATVAAGAGRAVPTKASGLHGASNLTIHESLHGYDYLGNHAVIDEAGFKAAREADWDRLGSYEKQQGQPGREETFAESGARFYSEPDKMGPDWVNLFTYWRTGPGQTAGGVVNETPAAAEEGDDAIGTAEFGEGGAIRLDLRAEGPGGAIGHAMFEIAPKDEAYGALRRHLLGDSPLAEAPAMGPIPFRAGNGQQ